MVVCGVEGGSDGSRVGCRLMVGEGGGLSTALVDCCPPVADVVSPIPIWKDSESHHGVSSSRYVYAEVLNGPGTAAEGGTGAEIFRTDSWRSFMDISMLSWRLASSVNLLVIWTSLVSISFTVDTTVCTKYSRCLETCTMNTHTKNHTLHVHQYPYTCTLSPHSFDSVDGSGLPSPHSFDLDVGSGLSMVITILF